MDKGEKKRIVEDEAQLARKWDELVVTNPAIPLAGIWKDGLYVCFYCDGRIQKPSSPN